MAVRLISGGFRDCLVEGRVDRIWGKLFFLFFGGLRLWRLGCDGFRR